jgi:hypothetical protein
MHRTTSEGLAPGLRGGFRLAALGAILGLSQVPATAQEARRFPVWDFGAMPHPAPIAGLLRSEAVQAELKMSDAQKKEYAAILERATATFQKLRSEVKDLAKFREMQVARAKELSGEILANLTPGQRERLDQIQLQGQGPFAFAIDGPVASALVGPPLRERLKLSDDQVRRARAIYEEGEKEIQKAASFPLSVDTKNGPATMEAIRKLVESPEFQGAKQIARKASRDASAAVTGRIEEILTTAQREAYHKMLGEPVDLSKMQIGLPASSEQERDIRQAANVLGLGGGGGGGGQQADPNFNTKVAHPAYSSGLKHPRVLFDEAHHNFHTAGGRYKPFAELMTSDGYAIIPNREKFARDALKKGDILVIANALGAEGMGQPGAADPAFTDAECNAVREWVQEGGSLLLISDHAPMGAAAECLAKRLGVSVSKGASSDPSNSEGSDTFLVFTRQNHLLGEHPITRGRYDSERLNRIKTFTGTSVKGPEGSVPILKLADTAVDVERGGGQPASAAGRAQGVAFSLGKGRVVVMGEAAELSAQVVGNGEKFGMNVPGIDNRQMALNIMHWLSGLLEPRESVLKKAG